ncbi:MAG: hypothetical protein AAB337_00400 [Patescibacteria group bacterium]
MILRYFLLEFVQSFVFVPIWWYTRGLGQMARFVARSVGDYESSLAVGVWLKNIFVPMYGSHDIAGRIISFFVRVAQIVGRSLFLLVYASAMLFLLLLYIIIPIVVAIEILIHIVGVLSV